MSAGLPLGALFARCSLPQFPRLGQRLFGIVLPNTGATEAARTATRVSEGLTDASGASDRFSFFLRAISFPENATSAHEMEHAALAFAAEEQRERAAA